MSNYATCDVRGLICGWENKRFIQSSNHSFESVTCCNQHALPACHLLVCHQNDGEDHGHDLCARDASFHHGGPCDDGLNDHHGDDDGLNYNNHCNHCNDSNHDCGHCGGSDGVRKNKVYHLFEQPVRSSLSFFALRFAAIIIFNF